MGNRSVIIAIVVGLVLFVLSGAMFTVSETELALKFRLGEVIKANYKPGLHWKTPFINNIRKFDKRILTLDANPAKYLTKEKKNVLVDFFVKWRISNGKTFYKAMSGSITTARNRIYTVINDNLRSEFSNRTIREVISGERREIMEQTKTIANKGVESFGITIVDVRIKRIDYEQSISDSIYQRMVAERTRVAKELRSQGSEAAEKIRAGADRKRTVLLAESYSNAQKIRGDGDAKAAGIFAKAYNRDPEFYAFYRSLQAYRKAFAMRGDVLVIEPDSEFFKYFKRARPKR